MPPLAMRVVFLRTLILLLPQTIIFIYIVLLSPPSIVFQDLVGKSKYGG